MLNQGKTETMDLQDEQQAPDEVEKTDGVEHTESACASEETTEEAVPSADDLSAQLTELQSKLAAADQKIEELEQRNLRAQADFDNFRRRTRTEKEELHKYAATRVIEGLLPVIDNFERAMESSNDSNDFDALVKGLNMTYTQLMQALEQEELKQIEAVGQPFNPEFHQAVMQVDTEEHEEGIVVEELQKGYMLNEKVLRPSMVKVSK